jgi:hypothetical protein
VRALALRRLNRIDMGIALCHLWVAARHGGREPVFYQDEEAAAAPPRGFVYTLSVRL